MVILSCNLVFVLGVCGADAPFVLDVEAPRVSYFSGRTLYEIEGISTDGDWRSRLKFPVNNVTTGGGVGLLFGGEGELRLGGWTTLDRLAGTMRDDDWLDGVNDIWSRSNAELEAWGVSAEATWWALRGRNGGLGPRLRAEYDRLDYDVKNVRQWAVDAGDIASVNGLVLTYRQERVSLIPGLAGFLRGALSSSHSVELGGFLGVSPWTYVWDRDDHLLRYKESETESLGVTFVGQAYLDFVCADCVRLGVWGEILYFRSWWGRQDQYFYGGLDPPAGTEYNNIEAEIRRQTFMVGGRLAIDF